MFYAAVEMDTSVNLVDVITPKGNRLQITSEPGTEVDNVKTWFGEADGVRVWEYEATFGDSRELKGYGKGDYTVEVHHDGGIAEARVKYGGTKPIWGIGAPVGDDDNEPPADVQKDNGQNKKAKSKSKKKSHKLKKPRDDEE